MTPRNTTQVNELLRAADKGVPVYLVGAGGCGMSGLGHLLLDLDHVVHGSDLLLNDEIRQLRARGAVLHLGHDAKNVRVARPALVVYSSAVRASNPELLAAQELKIPIIRRATLLAALMDRQRGICVAGMHGKTTTSALLAFAMEKLRAESSYAVGALVPQLERHARFNRIVHEPTATFPRRESGASVVGRMETFFVAETDESDGTLREFQPEHAIVLNVDADHLDYYVNLEAICREFQTFAEHTRGLLIFCADDSLLPGLFASRPRAVSYGFNPLATYRVTGVRPIGGCRPGSIFEIWRSGEQLGEFSTGLLGEKNVSNACAVVALLDQLGFATADIAGAISPFSGAARRQQELFADDRFRLFEDYGHYPSEIAATIAAMKSLPCRRLLVAFQPHRYTRTQHLLNEFAGSFGQTDKLWLVDIYAASEAAIAGVNGAALAETMCACGQPVEFIESLDKLPAAVRTAMQPGDLVLFLGAGDISRAAHQLARGLREEAPGYRERIFTSLTRMISAETVLRRDEPLAKKTTLRVGGPADFYVEPVTETELSALLQFCQVRGLSFVILGRGSNLLIKDRGIRGLVICLTHPNFNRIETVGNRVHCGAGARLKAVAIEARRRGVTNLEFLEGIPGSVGGALRMNAGAMGSWMFDAVETIRFMDYAGLVHERKATEVNVEYRGCPLFKNHVALGAVLKGEHASHEAVELRMHQFSRKRWDSQPAAPSAGCIFKNPGSISAGKLIDDLGLKGTRIGGAMVSDVHGNFIVNEGNATAQDVLNLIDIVKERAKSTRGIQLETEVEILGE